MYRLFFIFLFITSQTVIFSQNYTQKLFPNDPNTGVFFGRFLSINNNFAFISAYQDFENGTASGSLYVYEKEGNNFTQISKIFPNDGNIEDYFGYSIGSSGDWAITGAHHDSDFGASSGSAYILHKDKNDNWKIFQKLTPYDAAEADEFGKKVDIYENYIVSASYLDDDNGINSGSIYFYKWDGSKWKFEDKIHALDQGDYSQFGLALDLHKDKLIVGAPYKDECGKNCGTAYIFEKIEGKWTQTAKLVPNDISENDELGITVKIKNNTAIISSIKDDDNGINSGSIYIYKKENEKWNLSQKLTSPDGEAGDAFGIDLDFNESLLVVGAYFDDDNGTNSGSIYLYKLLEGKWTYFKKIVPTDSDESDAFGSSISIDSKRLLVGAYSDDDNGFFSGAAYIFSIDEILNDTKNLNYPNSKVKVYPSVFTSSIFIDFEDNTDNYKIEIFDINGKLILSKTSNCNKIEINTLSLNRGIYFLKTTTGKGIKTFKITKVPHNIN